MKTVESMVDKTESRGEGRELSIQIMPNGFSFTVSHNREFIYGSTALNFDFETVLGDIERYSSIYIGWNNDTVMLVPHEIFDPQYSQLYQRAANLNSPTEKTLYNSSLSGEIIALWGVPAEVYNRLQHYMPEAYHYHNLQLEIQQSIPDNVRITVVDECANVVITTQEGLSVAETIQFASPEDLLFFVLKANIVDKFARHALEFRADDTQPYRELFTMHFKNSNFINSSDNYHRRILRCE